MAPVHEQVLDAAIAQADRKRGWTFALRDVVRALPHLNAGTIRTHVASRCCVNAPSHHQSRHLYFRALGGGRYRVEPRFRRVRARVKRQRGWQDAVLAALDSGIDPTLIAESLKWTPTQRLERMRAALKSLDDMRRR